MLVVVVVVVVVIPVGGISSLLRRKAVFFSQSGCSLPHFHLPRPSPFLCSYEKKQEAGFFGALKNGVERNVKRR